MAKVYPKSLTFSSSTTEKRDQVFTIWMKSLVFHTNGCTVFDSDGEIVYRVDNYGEKCSKEVFLMDLQGQVLFTIRKKKLQFFGGYNWDGYRSWSEKICFKVRKQWKMVTMGSDFAFQITAGFDKYWIVKMGTDSAQKTTFRIIDINGDIFAEAKRKVTSSGVVLGDDVLSLEVKPNIDHSFIMAIVVVYGLIRRKM